jgi:hypothetical protein
MQQRSHDKAAGILSWNITWKGNVMRDEDVKKVKEMVEEKCRHA